MSAEIIMSFVPGRREMTMVRHGRFIRVDTLPPWQPVEQPNRRVRREQQRRVNPVFVKQPDKIGNVLQRDSPRVARKKSWAIQLGACINEDWNVLVNEVSAKIVLVENALGL